MRVEAENYKGIEFVRISTLPEDQKKSIWTSLKRDKIIKILKNDCLLNDCVQISDYEQWYSENYLAESIKGTASQHHKESVQEFKLAYK